MLENPMVYDLVELTRLPEVFHYFTKGIEKKAIVLEEYRGKYSVLFETYGPASWFDKEDMILIEKGQTELHKKWMSEAKWETP